MTRRLARIAAAVDRAAEQWLGGRSVRFATEEIALIESITVVEHRRIQVRLVEHDAEARRLADILAYHDAARLEALARAPERVRRRVLFGRAA